MKNFHPTGNCPVRDVLSRLGDKWSMLVLITLSANGTMRFSDIHKTIEDVSQRMLTVTLRTIESDGLVERKVYAEVPPRVEYCLTDRNGTASEEKIDTSSNHYGTVLNAQTLEHAIPTLQKGVEKIIVIENKANYESMEYDPKVLYIFCHGYFSPKEVRYLQMIIKTAPEEIQSYHWGELDNGGIQIFLYNEKNIFPNLIPWRMDAPSYKAALEKEIGIKL